jgi:hypothetical protein
MAGLLDPPVVCHSRFPKLEQLGSKYLIDNRTKLTQTPGKTPAIPQSTPTTP